MLKSTIKIKNPILSENRPPSAKEMEKFHSQYDKKQWARLCEDRVFIDAFSFDLKKAKEIADKIFPQEKPSLTKQ